MRARNAAWCVLAAFCCWAGPARGGPWLPPPGNYHTDFTGGFFSADTYHDASGGRVPLAFGGVEERRSLLTYNEFGWKKSASLILGLPIESVTRRSAGGEVNRTDTGISDLQLGMRIKMAEGRTAAALELTWYPPAGYNRKYLLSADTVAFADAGECAGLTGADSINCVRQMAPPRLGSGEQELSAAIHWGTEIRRFNGFLQVSQGYRYRGQLAGQALLTADVGFWVGHSLLLAGRYRGAIDVGRGDTRADDVEEHLAGPVVIYRLDDGMDVFFSSLHTAIARNALHADRFYVGVAFKKTDLDRLQGYLGGTKQP
jgi:hypothetical protein